MLAIAILGAIMVIGFQTNLVERVTHLPLDARSQALLIAQARNLGATVPPTGLSPELTQATQEAIQLAFVDSFQQVMHVCIWLTLLSVAVVLLLVRRPAPEPE